MFEDKVKKQNKGSLSKYLALWCKPAMTLFSRRDSSVGFPGSALQHFWFIASGCLLPTALSFPSRLRYFPASGTQSKTFALELTSQRSHRSLQRGERDKKISGQQKTRGQLTFTSGSTNIIQLWSEDSFSMCNCVLFLLSIPSTSKQLSGCKCKHRSRTDYVDQPCSIRSKESKRYNI